METEKNSSADVYNKIIDLDKGLNKILNRIDDVVEKLIIDSNSIAKIESGDNKVKIKTNYKEELL